MSRKNYPFQSDFLTSDSVVPACIFDYERQRVLNNVSAPNNSGLTDLPKGSLTISVPPSDDFRIYFASLIPAQSKKSARPPEQSVQFGCHSEKGQNAIINYQDIRIRGWSRKVPPIKRNELRVFGPLFFGSQAAWFQSRASGPPV